MNTFISSLSFPVLTFLLVVLDIILFSSYMKARKKLNPFTHAIYLVAMLFLVPVLIAAKYCAETPGVPESVITLIYVLLAIAGVALLVPLMWNFVLKWKSMDLPSGTKTAFIIYIAFFGTMFLIGLVITMLEK